MANTVNVTLMLLQILIQLGALYASYIIYKYNRLNKAWLAVTLALFLMTLRRVTALLIELGILTQLQGPIKFADSILLPFVISIFLFAGLINMKKQFETFDIIEKKIDNKLNKK